MSEKYPSPLFSIWAVGPKNSRVVLGNQYSPSLMDSAGISFIAVIFAMGMEIVVTAVSNCILSESI
ncbi:hypothetical protein HY768_11040 [candidate division TA06 bacterium]|uniref:Uncharacterized protein n=1 Tax=candidate division TA06 bacterium TaxID=2250710 RepID=A0A933IG12_UNCT6|nr:hypothetical protein [candidate division TA06 bacterium]